MVKRDPYRVYKLPSDQYDRLSTWLEQIAGLNNMLFVAAQTAIEESNEAMTAHMLLREKYEQAKVLLESAESVLVR